MLSEMLDQIKKNQCVCSHEIGIDYTCARISYMRQLASKFRLFSDTSRLRITYVNECFGNLKFNNAASVGWSWPRIAYVISLSVIIEKFYLPHYIHVWKMQSYITYLTTWNSHTLWIFFLTVDANKIILCRFFYFGNSFRLFYENPNQILIIYITSNLLIYNWNKIRKLALIFRRSYN